MKMRKLLIVDENQVVGFAGGAEAVVCNLANMLSKRGWQVALACMNRENGMPWYPLRAEVEFMNLCYNGDGNPFSGVAWLEKKIRREILRGIGGANFRVLGHVCCDPKREYVFRHYISRLRKYILQYKPNVIMSVTANSAWLVQQALSSEIGHVPVVCMSHSSGDEYEKMSAREREAWGKCELVQVLQPQFVEPAKANGAKRVVVIPNSVQQIKDDEVCDLQRIHHCIMTAGRLEGNGKRQHLLIEAFALLADCYPEWELKIYGEAENRRYERYLKKLIKEKRIENRVYLKGKATKLVECFYEADIFVFPSKTEGFGLALCEAMSAGLPVVACKECYCESDIIKDGVTGMLVEETPESIASALKFLIEKSSVRKQLGHNAHLAMKEYAPEIIADKWEKVLENIF